MKKSMDSSLSDLRRKVDRHLRDYEVAKHNIKAERKRISAAKEELSAAEEAQKILQSVAVSVQEQAHKRIAQVVTRCLRAVFEDEAYEFHILFERKRGKTDAKLVFSRDGIEINPMKASGGGVIDVASFALRLACIMLRRPQARRLLVLDEPMKFLHSPEYRARLVTLLETLSEELKIQIILVTGIDDYRIGKVIEIY